MDILYIVMRAYNEEDNIEQTVRSWYPIIEKQNSEGKSKLIVFNDGSRDQTGIKGKELMKEFSLFEMIDKPNSGHGPTLIYAYDLPYNAGRTLSSRQTLTGRQIQMNLKHFGR